MSALIVARGVSLEWANGRELFNDLSFSLHRNVSALVGPNGVGKTSLARVLAGELPPTAGVVQRQGSLKYFAQRELPTRDTVAAYLANEYEWSLLGERLLAGIDLERPCTTLSGGQWTRVRLARVLSRDYLIFDEPTNDLDRQGREAVLQFLREHSNGVLLISHDRECLRSCEEILELSNRGLARFGGGWDGYALAKEHERQRLQAALDSAKRERDAAHVHRIEQRARQEKRNRRGAASAARGGAPKILLGAHKRAAQVSTGKLDFEASQKSDAAVRAAHAALSELKIDPVMYAEVAGTPLPAQKLIAEAQQFNIRFADWLYARDLEFSWRGNVRLALEGPNGAGKSTLLNALAGVPHTTRGELRIGNVGTLHLDQRCSLLADDSSVLENVRSVSTESESVLRTALARYLFTGDAVHRKVKELSGGERLRAALARGFLGTHRPELLLLDEPTNNFDLANVAFLEQVVRAFRGAVIVVTHDQQFLHNCAIDAIIRLPLENASVGRAVRVREAPDGDASRHLPRSHI